MWGGVGTRVGYCGGVGCRVQSAEYMTSLYNSNSILLFAQNKTQDNHLPCVLQTLYKTNNIHHLLAIFVKIGIYFTPVFTHRQQLLLFFLVKLVTQ